MQLHDFLWTAGILLAVLTVATQIFARLRLGAVLGTLVAGVLLGPWGADLAHDVDRARNFTELGVVFLMFTIGLEMDFAKLARMRRLVFGLGSLQILLSGALIALAVLAAGRRRARGDSRGTRAFSFLHRDRLEDARRRRGTRHSPRRGLLRHAAGARPRCRSVCSRWCRSWAEGVPASRSPWRPLRSRSRWPASWWSGAGCYPGFSGARSRSAICRALSR